MHLNADLAGRNVLVAGSATAARRVVRRYLAAGAKVHTIQNHSQFHTSVLDEVMLVAAVDDGDPSWAPLPQACHLHSVLLVREPAAEPGGVVILVGGGPGPTDLITARGLAELREADVVYYDKLGPHQDLDLLAPGAQLIDVGKTPGHHPVSQRDIEQLMLASARIGHRVVRLKGGDPFVFGRGAEETAACAAAGVPVTVVPGISSSIAVPAAARIPVTHRNVSHVFTVVSGHAPLTEREHGHLAGLGGTIVVLMGIATLPQLTSGLLKAGMRTDTPVAVVERGYRLDQRTTIASLGTIVPAAAKCSSPAVLVIGDVVALGQAHAVTTEIESLTDLLHE